MRQALILAACFAMGASCTAQEANVDKLLARSDPAIQEQFHQILKVYQVRAKDPRTNIEALLKAQTLKASITDKGEIVKQVVIFAATPTDEEHQSLFALVILHVLDLPPITVIRALAPYLDAENEDIRSFAQDWFQGHDKGNSGALPLDPVHYEEYARYVSTKTRRNEEVPTAFVEYIYERSPARALLVFLRADRQKDIIARLMEMRKNHQRGQEKRGLDTLPLPPVTNLPDEIPPLRDEIHRQRDEKLHKEIQLAEHIVSNAIWLKKNKFGERFQEALPEANEHLAKLAEHEKWWVRRYVVEIRRRHREFGQ